MVKCAKCGFLCYRNLEDRALVEAEANFRETGKVPQPDRPTEYDIGIPSSFVAGGGFGDIPICFARAADLDSETKLDKTNQSSIGQHSEGAVLRAITKERECAHFTTWYQGFTPKEHREMLDRDNMLIWQRDREESDRVFQAREAAENRKWRFREFLVAVIGVAVVVGVSLTAAFIERAGQPDINILVSDKSSVTQGIQPGELSEPGSNAP